MLKVTSTKSSHQPYPWAGAGGLCGHSLAWENFVLETHYPAQCFDCVHCITTQTVMQSELKQGTPPPTPYPKMGHREKEFLKLIIPTKRLL